MINEPIVCTAHKTYLPTLNQCENEHGTVEMHYTLVNVNTKERRSGKFIYQLGECSTKCLYRDLKLDEKVWELERWAYKFH